MRTKFSVVIPLFNKERYIERAIMSIMGQSLLPDEIIVVDDGSTDDGMEIVTELSNPLIRTFSTKNHGDGGSAARNLGIAESKNEFIAFLDADDEWKPGHLEQIRLLIEKFQNCGAYANSYEVITGKNDKYFPKIVGVPSSSWMGILPEFFKILQENLPFCTPSIVIPKTILKKIGGFPTDLKSGGDLITWIKIALDYPIAFNSSRQVIVYTNAINRVSERKEISLECDVYRQKFLGEVLRDRQFDDLLTKDIKDYYSLTLFNCAKKAIIFGKQKDAKKYLSKFQNNIKYRKKWFFLKALTIFPKKIIKIFNSFFKILKIKD